MDLAKITELATVMRALNILRMKTPEVEIELYYQEEPELPPEEQDDKEQDSEVVSEDLYAEVFGGKKPSFR